MRSQYVLHSTAAAKVAACLDSCWVSGRRRRRAAKRRDGEQELKCITQNGFSLMIYFRQTEEHPYKKQPT